MMPIPDDFDQMIKQMGAATQHFLAGDPVPYKACWSHSDDVTIMGALGAYEKGWEQVGSRLDWVAARYHGGHATFEPISIGMSGDLAYLIYLQIGEVRLTGRDEFSPLALRVTDIFRHEEGAWKIIHRHADPIMEKDHAHGGPPKGVTTMSIQDNKRIVRGEFEEIWNQGKLDLIDTHFSADFINFGRPCPLDLVHQIFEAWRTAFPDLHYTVDAQIAEGDQVLSHCTLSGTHLGPFVLFHLWSLPPTGKHFSVRHMHLHRLCDGQIVEHWAVRDDLGMLQQLGVIPTPVHG